MLQRVGARLSELARLEARRINLETHVEVLQKSDEGEISAEESMRMQSEYVNSDSTVQEPSALIKYSEACLESDLAAENQPEADPTAKNFPDLIRS